MPYHHRMHHVLHRSSSVVDPSGGVGGVRVTTLGAEYMARRMHRLELVEGFPEARWQGIVGGAHVGKQGVAAYGGQFTRQQDRAHGRDFVVAVVGVPPAADAGGLGRFLADIGDLGVPRHGLEKPVDIDRCPAPRKCQVLLRTQVLVVEEDHTVVQEGLAHAAEVPVRQRSR